MKPKALTKQIIYRAVPKWFFERFYHKRLLPRLKPYAHRKAGSGALHNILQVNTALNQGGAAKVSYRLSTGLEQSGFHVKNIVKEPMDFKEAIHYLSAANKGLSEFANMSSLNIIKRPEFLECDLVHLHNLHGNYFNPFILPEMTALKPTIWTLHDMQAITGHCAHSFQCEKWQHGCGDCPDLNIYPAISRDETAFLWETKRQIYALSDLVVVCPSNWLKQKLTHSILRNKDVHLIYNGVDTNLFKPHPQREVREKLGLPLNKKILLFSAVLGTDNPWKGSQYLNAAYEALKNEEDILFLNIGGKGSGMQANWCDIPYIHDEETMALYYAAADLLIYPSLADNCPLVVLEAMACGLPAVSFKTGGIPELICHGEDGYLADYKNEAEFIKGILYFLEHPDSLAKARQLAVLKVADGFSLAKMTESYIKLYEACYYKS